METPRLFSDEAPLIEDGTMPTEPESSLGSSSTSTVQALNGLPSDGSSTVPKSVETHVDIPGNSKGSRKKGRKQPTKQSKKKEEPEEVSLEEVVKAMCAAWRPDDLKPYEDEITIDFFNEMDLYKMHLAWKKVTKGRRCKSKPSEILEALAAAITNELEPRRNGLDIGLLNQIFDCGFHTTKNILAAQLLPKHQVILKGCGFPDWLHQVFPAEPDEQAPAISEFWIKQVKRYNTIHDFVFDSRFQIFLQSLLILWPISIFIIGLKYVECPMSFHLSRLLIALGSIGLLAVLAKISLIHSSALIQHPEFEFYNQWLWVQLIESAFIVVLLIQAYHVFNIDPATEPDQDKCVEKFYYVALLLNYVSIALVSACAFARFAVTFLKKIHYSDWIFRIVTFRMCPNRETQNV